MAQPQLAWSGATLSARGRYTPGMKRNHGTGRRIALRPSRALARTRVHASPRAHERRGRAGFRRDSASRRPFARRAAWWRPSIPARAERRRPAPAPAFSQEVSRQAFYCGRFHSATARRCFKSAPTTSASATRIHILRPEKSEMPDPFQTDVFRGEALHRSRCIDVEPIHRFSVSCKRWLE